MGALLTWLAGAFASLVGYSAVRFTAWKLVIYTLTVTILPIVLTNLIYTIIESALTLADDVQGSYGLSSVVVQFTGIAAWFATYLDTGGHINTPFGTDREAGVKDDTFCEVIRWQYV